MNLFYHLEEYAQDQKTADKTFLIYEDRQWTYEQTYEMVLKYGTFLKSTYGIKPMEIVAMNYMNSEKFIFLWLGLWSIGACPAFINYNLTDKALAHCIRISTASRCILDPEVESKVTQAVRDEVSGVHFIIFTPDLQAQAMSIQAVREPNSVRSGVEPSTLAMLIYTSGTTGLPKPAIVSWSKVIVSAAHVSDWSRMKPDDIYYTCMPLYHSSAAILGACVVLMAGMTLHLGHKFSTKTFWPEVRASKATVIQYVGETCRYLLTAPPQHCPEGKNLDRENHVRMAFGNGLRPDVWNRFKERFGIEAIAEFYGATEGTNATWNYTRNDFAAGAIGRNGLVAETILGCRVHAVVKLDWATELPYRDPKTGLCQRVPKGLPGEMLYALDATDISKKFQGYFNNSGASQSKILRDVLKKGDAWFRTGDVIRQDPNGLTFFMDRIGDTFRWKSENVSTSEVSESLGVHPAVHEANVYGVEIPHHDGRAGCVSITLTEGVNEIILKELADHARRTLPKFAVPLFLRVKSKDGSASSTTGTNKQQKHVLRQEGVDPTRVGEDELYWLKPSDGERAGYVKFGQKEWQELSGGSVKL